jgi:hypothetical protein
MDALTWRKSSYSAANGDCVETASCDGAVLIRDTKTRQHGHVTVLAEEWREFVAGLRNGGFEVP